MFKKIILWLLILTLSIPAIGTVLYFTVPKVKDYINEKILKIEETTKEDNESTENNDEVVSDLQAQIENNKTVIANLNSELEKQRAEVTKLQNSAQLSEERIETLQTNIEETEAELATVISEKTILENKKSELETEIELKKTQLEELQSAASEDQETIANLEADIQAKQTELAGLEAKAAEDQATITTLQSNLANKQAELEVLQNNASVDAETISGLESEISNIQTQLNTLQTKVEEDATTIINLQNEVSEKQTAIDELEAQAEEDAVTIQNLNNTIAQKQNLLNNAYDEINTKDAQILELDATINNLEDERDLALADLASTTEDLNEANANITTLENEVATKEVEIASLNEQVLYYQNALNRDESKMYIDEFLVNERSLTYLKVSDFEYFVSCSSNSTNAESGLFLLNTIDGSMVKVYHNYYGYNKLLKLTNGNMLITNSASRYPGILMYDKTTQQATSIYNNIGYINCMYQVSDDKVLFSSETSNGIYLCTLSDSTVTQLYTGGRAYSNFINLGNGDYLFSSNQSSYLGIYLYSNDSNSVTKVYDNGYKYDYSLKDNKGKVLISSTLSNNKCGVLLYDVESKSFQVLKASTLMRSSAIVYHGFRYEGNNAAFLSNGDILFVTDDNVVNLFDLDENSVVDIATIGAGGFDITETLNDTVLFGFASNGVYAYDVATKEIAQLTTNYIMYPYLLSNGNILLLDSTFNCFCKFDYETKIITLLKTNLSNFYHMGCIDFGSYVEIYNLLNENEKYYYVYSSDTIVETKPTTINIVNTTEDLGTVALDYYTLVDGSTITVTSNANTGYTLEGLYLDADCTVALTLTNDYFTYSDVSAYIDAETNTLTIYSKYRVLTEDDTTGQEPPETGNENVGGFEPGV